MNDDSWDLQAVVRSCGRATAAFAHVGRNTLSTAPSPLLYRDTGSEGLLSLHPAFEELEEICRPFFSSSSQQKVERRAPSLLGRLQQPKQRPVPHTAARSKRRKNQVKKVVCQVPADGVCSDVWAWRKYGQKPIKGSPFPRGYYRCSSSKGCPARKLVERSRTDPNSFLITYTAEHNHAVPAHRNCLAGSTRNKPMPLPHSRGGEAEMTQQKKDSSSSSNVSDSILSCLSPTTPLTVSGGEEVEDVQMLMRLGEDLEDGVCCSASGGVIEFSCCSC